MDRRSSRRAVLTSGTAVAVGVSAPRVWATVIARDTRRLRRGINVHHLLNWPVTRGAQASPDYIWPPFADPLHALRPEELRRIRALGFDFIRLTVSPAIFLAAGAARRDDLAAIVRDRLAQAAAADLAVVLDLHPVAQDPRYTPDLVVDPNRPDVFDAYERLVGWLAAVLDAAPDRPIFELLNEPAVPRSRDAPRWQTLMERLHDSARRAAPTLPLVITGANWSAPDALRRIDTTPFRASNVLYTFHYYLPRLFTHQGLASQEARYIRGLRWPPEPGMRDAIMQRSAAAIRADPHLDAAQRADAEKETTEAVDAYVRAAPTRDAIGADFARVAAWATQSDVPPERILLGEYGATRFETMDAAQLADRALWLSTVRAQAEAQRFGWAYWSYRSYGGMALADETPAHAVYGPDLVALGLANEP